MRDESNRDVSKSILLRHNCSPVKSGAVGVPKGLFCIMGCFKRKWWRFGTVLIGGGILNIGYVRVSAKDQNEDRQVEALQDKVEKIFIDKATGANTDRPQLQTMLSWIREGDVVYFDSISRLARNTQDFLELMDLFQEKGVGSVSLKEPIDTTTAAGRMITTVFAAMYQMERENNRQLQREGIAVARTKGVKFGRPKLQSDDFDNIYRRWKAGKIRAVAAIRELGMKKSTFYRRVREIEGRSERGSRSGR